MPRHRLFTLPAWRRAVQGTLLAMPAVLGLAACALDPIVTRQGNQPDPNFTPQDRSRAHARVAVVELMPEGALPRGRYMVLRCAAADGGEPPTASRVMDDLILLADARGANGIALVEVARDDFPPADCPAAIRATGQFFLR